MLVIIPSLIFFFSSPFYALLSESTGAIVCLSYLLYPLFLAFGHLLYNVQIKGKEKTKTTKRYSPTIDQICAVIIVLSQRFS